MLSPSRSPSRKRSPSARGRSATRSVSRQPALSMSPNPHRDSRPGRSPSARKSISRSRSVRSPSVVMPRSSKIVVEKLTKNVNEGHLREVFGTYGQVVEVDMPLNRQFMTNRGTAYVLFHDPASAESAISHMHEAQLDGAQINVSIVLPRRRFSRSPPAKRPPPQRFGEPHTRMATTSRPLPPPGGRDSGRYRSPPRRRRSRDGRYDQDSRNGPRSFKGRDRSRSRRRHRSYSPSRSRSLSPRRIRDRDRSRSRSRSRTRSRSPLRKRSYSRQRSISRSPPRRRAYSPPRGSKRRRSPSYDSRSRSPVRSRSPPRRRSRSPDRRR